jgi:hypothetical protein
MLLLLIWSQRLVVAYASILEDGSGTPPEWPPR